jgi:hypothetical protein
MDDDKLNEAIRAMFKNVSESTGNKSMMSMSSNLFSSREDAVKMSPFSKEYVAGEGVLESTKEKILLDHPDALRNLEDLIVSNIDRKINKIIENL